MKFAEMVINYLIIPYGDSHWRHCSGVHD